MQARLILSALFFSQALFAANIADPNTTPFLTAIERQRALLIEKDLQSLGFSIDHIIASLKKQHKNLSETQIKDLQQRYAVMESSAQGAAVIFSFLESRLTNEAMENRLIELLGRFLVYGIKGLPNQLPPEIENLTDGKEKQAQAENFLKNYLAKAMNQTKNELLGDIASVFYTADEIKNLEQTKDSQYLMEKQALEQNISQLVQSMYLDLQQTHTRFFGRAMAQAFLRYTHLQKRQDLAERFKQAVENKGLHFSELTSTIYIGKDERFATQTELKDGNQLVVEKAFAKGPEGRWNKIKDAIKPVRHNEATGVVQVLKRADLGLAQVWVIGKNNLSFTDMTGFAPPGVTMALWLLDRQKGRVTMTSDRKSEEEARQLRFYGNTFFPLDAGVNAYINLNSKNIEADGQKVQAIVARAMDTEEFRTLLSETGIKKNQLALPSLDTSGANVAMHDQGMREFLYELGFDNLSGEVRDYYSKGLTYHAGTQGQQYRNILSYQMINGSRELAILLVNKLQKNLQQKDGLLQALDLGAYLLSQQPIHNIKQIPNEILKLDHEKPEYRQKLDAYSEQALRLNLSNHYKILTADILSSLYDGETLKAFEEGTLEVNKKQEISETTKKIALYLRPILDRMYMDLQVGQTRFLGRAYMALLYRWAELNNINIHPLAQAATLKYGMRIENFIGDELLLDTENNTPIKTKVSDLSMVLSRTIDMDTVAIPFGAIPGDFKRAKDRGLIGSLLAGLLVVTEDTVEKSYTAFDRLRDRAFYTKWNNGYSHIGYAFVKKAKNSNIKMTWMMDNYPHLLADSSATETVPGGRYNDGGLRYVGLEQFYLPSHHSKIFITNVDWQKLFEHAQNEVKSKGIPQTGGSAFPFPTYKIKLDSFGRPAMQDITKSERDDWTIITPQERLNDLYASKDVETFKNKYLELVKFGFTENIKMGMTFVWITPYGQYYKGTGYCSSTAEIISRVYAGLTLEPVPTDFRNLMKFVVKFDAFADKIGAGGLTEGAIDDIAKMAKMGLIAPSSLANQNFMTDYWTVVAPIRELGQRALDDWSFRVEKNNLAMKVVNAAFGIDDQIYFAYKQLDPTEIRAVSHTFEKREKVHRSKLGLNK
jgi:hypothetical protein